MERVELVQSEGPAIQQISGLFLLTSPSNSHKTPTEYLSLVAYFRANSASHLS